MCVKHDPGVGEANGLLGHRAPSQTHLPEFWVSPSFDNIKMGQRNIPGCLKEVNSEEMKR